MAKVGLKGRGAGIAALNDGVSVRDVAAPPLPPPLPVRSGQPPLLPCFYPDGRTVTRTPRRQQVYSRRGCPPRPPRPAARGPHHKDETASQPDALIAAGLSPGCVPTVLYAPCVYSVTRATHGQREGPYGGAFSGWRMVFGSAAREIVFEASAEDTACGQNCQFRLGTRNGATAAPRRAAPDHAGTRRCTASHAPAQPPNRVRPRRGRLGRGRGKPLSRWQGDLEASRTRAGQARQGRVAPLQSLRAK